MITTVCLAFVAGFFAGNGVPYYNAGSTGAPQNPSPFRDTPTANVVLGWSMFLIAGAAWVAADVDDHPGAGYAAAALGVLAVGLIHARVWRVNPWGKRNAAVVAGLPDPTADR